MCPSRTNAAGAPSGVPSGVASPDEDASPPITAQHRRQHLDKTSARRVTAVACLTCQRRKSKCDGARPTCSACHQRGGTCGYETADGLTRMADLKHKNSLLTSRNSKLERVFAKLRSEDDNEASSTLARLRLGDEISQILGVADDTDRSRTHSVAKFTDPRINFDSGFTDQGNWRPSSPASQISAQSPAASTTNHSFPPYRSSSQARAPELSKQQWIMPSDDIKQIPSSTVPTGTWFTDGDGHRRASSSSIHMPNTSLGQFAPRLRGAVDPALQKIESYTQGSTSHESDLVFEGIESRKGTKQLDDWGRAGRPRSDVMENSSLAEAIDVLDPEQHMEFSLSKMFQSAASLPRGISRGSIPVWAILPKYRYDPHPANTAFSSFMIAKRSEISRGVDPNTFMGPALLLEGMFDQQAFAAADDLSRWAIEMGNGLVKDGVMRMVSVYIAWWLMRWMILPNPETYEAIPQWLRPTPYQLLIPHNASTDFLHSPQFRDAVVRNRKLQENSDWIMELTKIVDVNWPYSVEAGLEKDGETGLLRMNPLLRSHIDNPNNWSISSRLRAFMPNADTYLELRLPED